MKKFIQTYHYILIIGITIIGLSVIFSILINNNSPSNIPIPSKTVNVFVPPAHVNIAPIDTLYANYGNNATHIRTYNGCYYVINDFRGKIWGSHSGTCPNKIHYLNDTKIDSMQNMINIILLNQSIINEKLIKIQILQKIEFANKTNPSLKKEAFCAKKLN